MIRIMLGVFFFLAFTAPCLYCLEVYDGEAWGRMWNQYGQASTKSGTLVRASRPMREWDTSPHSPAFSANLASIHVQGSGWSHSFIAYESESPGVYWVSRVNSNGEERRGRGGARFGFKIYGEEGIFSKHLAEDGLGLNKEGWLAFRIALAKQDRQLGLLLKNCVADVRVQRIEVSTRVHPEAGQPDLAGELKAIHVLRNDTFGDFEMVDISR